ncbi:relaxase MobL [Kribbella qitaiheensis]|uniref:relaxase MobL n=1 Tax=Kribbella qitaiheensis TaxID=1544730 RepID=UPI00162740A6|nr:relaxase MobL [Kribbella qitaiheensis]
MGLKQEVVIVNEFSIKTRDGAGSRGATPGSYVERYMARPQATESLAPVQRLRTDDFIVRYMARASAVERAGSRAEAKRAMRQAQGNGGVAFGYGSVSLSDEQLHAASKDIQHYFDAGHTVLKTVLSFDETYLKKNRIVDQDFHCEARGDYRGHIDQMKLRMAIMRGLEAMSSGSSGFDDLRYVGVIQVDTEHVHCHLAMVDAGTGTVTPNGTQRGKLLDRHKSRLRRGIDAWLDEKQVVAHLSSAVGYERRNVTTFIKRWAHDRMRDDALPQFLIACLPQDRRLWRAGSNDRRMRKANQLATELVTEQLERPGSPMPAAMERIVEYANERRAKESLTPAEWQQIVDRGRTRIVERAVNGVYQLVRSLPADELSIRTPMLDVMGMDLEQIAALPRNHSGNVSADGTDLVSFAFRLRSYSSRLQHHKKHATAYHDLTGQWSKAEAAGVAAQASRPLYDFYRFELEYHRQLMAKYQHFLPFAADSGAWYERHRQLSDYGRRLLSLISLRADASLQRMHDAQEAERVGREIYGQPGGRLLTTGTAGRTILDHRILTMRRSYDQQLDDLRTDLYGSGLVLATIRTADGSDSVEVRRGVDFEFDEVKGLDLHHLGYDFFSDITIGARTTQTFVTVAELRRKSLLAAMTYLHDSGQSRAITDLPIDDIAAMTKLASTLARSRDPSGRGVLPSRFTQLRTQPEHRRRHPTSALDAALVVRLRNQIDQAALTASTRTESETSHAPGPEPNRDPATTQANIATDRIILE